MTSPIRSHPRHVSRRMHWRPAVELTCLRASNPCIVDLTLRPKKRASRCAAYRPIFPRDNQRRNMDCSADVKDLDPDICSLLSGVLCAGDTAKSLLHRVPQTHLHDLHDHFTITISIPYPIVLVFRFLVSLGTYFIIHDSCYRCSTLFSDDVAHPFP